MSLLMNAQFKDGMGAPESNPASVDASSAFHPVSANGSMHPQSGSLMNSSHDDLRTTTEEEEVDSPTPSSSESPGPNSPTLPGKAKGKGTERGRDAFAWPSHSDEQRQLITEEESSDRDSDEEDRKSVFAITKEQLNYYTTQFFNLQPNPAGIVPGTLAKEFFERSRLPINELRTIWQLSDVSKDGGLSLEEFLTAMHLVVLRRNDIKLPDTLPQCLCPTNLKRRLEPNLVGMEGARPNEEEAALRLSDDASHVSSPGGREQPVNFDFSRLDVRRDPHIVQPVALRVSDSPPLDSTTCQSSDLDETEDEAKRAEQLRRPSGQKQPKGEVHYEQLWNAAKDDDDDSVDGERGFHNRLKQQSLDAGAGLGPASLPPNKVKGGHPPPPPPRAGHRNSHARSSSLDLNRYQQTQHQPPAIPPRHQTESPAQDDESDARSPSPRALAGHAAFLARQSGRLAGASADHGCKASQMTKDIKSLQISIHEYKERNSVVARTINELHQEVSDTLEERIALEYQLEQLKSFGE